MATKFRIIKSTDYDVKGVQHTTHTVAYKGRVLSVNSLQFVDEGKDALTVDGDMLTIKVDVELRQSEVNDLEGKRTFINVVPKLDLALAL